MKNRLSFFIKCIKIFFVLYRKYHIKFQLMKGAKFYKKIENNNIYTFVKKATMCMFNAFQLQRQKQKA